MINDELPRRWKNIAAVSHELGFNDQSHLTRAFKLQYGLTPGQFIKQYKST
ncbi:helix-turn-helix domain-containing protein [Vibrio sp. TBV020]|uniref:helix-turn-helix domain-containing protein n=1 Tax=Vibrio sp. TBV020 TaxID=3137398 RepID=UPI0038CD58AF